MPYTAFLWSKEEWERFHKWRIDNGFRNESEAMRFCLNYFSNNGLKVKRVVE